MKSFNEEEKQKNQNLMSPVRGLARSIFGLSMGATVIGFSFARSVVGVAVNAGLALTGIAVGTGIFVVHVANWLRVQATNFVKKDSKSNVDFTKNLLDKTANFISERLKAAYSTFYNVFSGKRDEEIKSNLVSMITPSDGFETSPKFQRKKDRIESIPNTKELIVTATRLTMGMSPRERANAEYHAAKNRLNQHDREV